MKGRIGSENPAEFLNLVIGEYRTGKFYKKDVKRNLRQILDDDEQFFEFKVIAQALLKIIENIVLDLINHTALLYATMEERRH